MNDLGEPNREDIFAAVCFRGRWRFYVDHLPTWIMNYESYEGVGDAANGPRSSSAPKDQTEDFVFRGNIYVADDTNAEEFCRAISPKQVSIEDIRTIVSSHALVSTDLKIVIDFDRRLYVDGTFGDELCRFVPPGWTCIEEYPVPYIPESIDAWPREWRAPWDWHRHVSYFPIPNTRMSSANYADQKDFWPASGRHIMAQHDEESIVVYQAYRPEIARFAVQNQQFGGDFSFNRMSWIKPNFLWMMYRSGWGTKASQEATLAVRIKRSAFDSFLAQAVPSYFDPEAYATHKEWSSAVANSTVRFQWDPDHAPRGGPIARRAVQIGLRGVALRDYGHDAIISIEDISDFVADQRLNLDSRWLQTPLEWLYVPSDRGISRRLGLDDY